MSAVSGTGVGYFTFHVNRNQCLFPSGVGQQGLVLCYCRLSLLPAVVHLGVSSQLPAPHICLAVVFFFSLGAKVCISGRGRLSTLPRPAFMARLLLFISSARDVQREGIM